MKVAVLMSTYNGEKYLREQIDSILAQEGKFELELKVRDDGSSDSTLQILQEYADEKKLTWYQGENVKSAKSFLELVNKYSGYEYYAFADQDDYWMPDKISRGIKQIELFKEPTIYYSNVELVNQNMISLGRTLYRKEPTINVYTVICAANVIGCTMVFNEALAQVIRSHTNPKVVVMHDAYLARVCTAIGGKIVYDSIPHMKYRQHENNVVGVKRGIFNICSQRIKDILKKADISIADQSNEILKLYGHMMTEENQKWLKRVSEYRNSLYTRASLACTRKTKYITANMAFKLRMAILLGNR